MPSMEKFSLKWNDFSANVHKSFQNLRKEEDFCDITLVGDDCKHVTAHKLVLSSSSEYFKMVLSNNKKYFQSHPLVCLEGLNQSDLNNVLDYIYHGELQLHQQDLKRFIGIAKRLKLEGLVGAEGQKVANAEITENILEAEEQKVENANTTDDTLEQSVLTLHNNPVSKSAKEMIKEEKTDKFFTTVQSLDVQSKEELDKKADKSYSWINSTGLYSCHHCSKTFKARHHMREHVEIHLDLSFSCTICDAVLSSRTGLRQHNKRKHSDTLTESIQEDYILISKTEKHVMSDMEELDQKVEAGYSKVSTGLYQCLHCPKTFKERHHMKEHVEIHFQGLSFPCTMCDSVLKSRGTLRAHKKRQHNS